MRRADLKRDSVPISYLFLPQNGKNDLVFCDISGSTDPFGLKFHRDAGKNISFRFVKKIIFFEPPVFVQKAKCDIRFTEREITYSKSLSISQHNVFNMFEIHHQNIKK